MYHGVRRYEVPRGGGWRPAMPYMQWSARRTSAGKFLFERLPTLNCINIFQIYFYILGLCVLLFISGSTLWACLLQCLYNTVVCPAADMSCWPHGSDTSSPPACAPHHAQHAVQTSDQLWQCGFWVYGHTAAWPAAVTPQGLWAQPQKACQLWGGMWVSGFHLAEMCATLWLHWLWFSRNPFEPVPKFLAS